MKPKDVLETVQLLEKEEINVWLDGGWGVDALLGEQTRTHKDMDIVIQEKDIPKLRTLLEARGYRDVERDDTTAWNFVLGNDKGCLIDVHAFTFDSKGNGIYGPAERGLTYPAACLTGSGKIDRFTVKCITAEQIVKFHTGYEPDENDIKDVSALCERFGIFLPSEYKKKISS